MKIYGQTFLVKSNMCSPVIIWVSSLRSFRHTIKLLFMFGDYGYDISTEMGKELDYLTKLCLVKAFNVRKIVLEN